MTRIQTFRLVIMAAVLCNYVGEGLAQSDVNEIVRSQMTGDDFHIFVDPHALELFGDSVITSLNSDGDETWNTWKDVLSNGNSPGMDVNFEGWNAYGIDSLLIQGAAKLDSTLEVDGYVRMDDGLYVAMYALFQSKLSIGDSLVVAGGTDLNSTLDVAGDLAAASALTVTGNAMFNSTLDVDGDTEMDTVNVAGSLTVADHLDLNDSLNVQGKTILNDSLVVNGNVVFNTLSSIQISLDDDGNFGYGEGAFIGIFTGDSIDEALYIDTDNDDEVMYIDGWYDLILTADEEAGIEMSYDNESMYFYADSMMFEEGDVRIKNSLEVSGTIAANGLQIAAIERTATLDGAGDGIIPPGTSFVSVTSVHPDSTITLPPPVPGSTVSLYCADPYTLRTSDPTSISILDVGGEIDVDSDLLLRCTCVSSTKWIVWSHPGEAP